MNKTDELLAKLKEYLWHFNWNPELAPHDTVYAMVSDAEKTILELQKKLDEVQTRNAELVVMVVDARIKARVNILTGLPYGS